MVTAVQQVRRMRGGAQSQLMRCRDVVTGREDYWVVKFKNNPQHVRVLANELLATRLAERIGLPVPMTDSVEVSDWLVEHSPELRQHFAGRDERCSSGLQFGARYVVDPAEGQVYDYIPEALFDRVRNLNDFVGMLCLDKWTCNANGRQAVYWKKGRERKYTVTFVDQGYCFNAGEWNFPDAPLRGVYPRNAVYAGVRGWESFEPWLSRIAGLEAQELWKIAEAVPPEWYEYDLPALEKLVEELYRRRTLVPQLIEDFRVSGREPFPGWTAKAAVH